MNEVKYAIDVRNLSKSFDGKKVVKGIDIKVEEGRIFGFLGPNGSGKTTTIRMICGLMVPDTGEGICLGYDIFSQASKIQQNIGYMTQKFSYWEDLTVIQNLFFVADMYALDSPKDVVEQAIKEIGLEKYRNHLVGNLSGGWKQRLALAACTLHKPKLLLLDEPTTGVDPKARREFWDRIHRMAADGMTVLVSTHYMDEAERCHKIIYIAGGYIMVEGTVDEVVKHSGLSTWIVKGQNLSTLQQELMIDPNISSVAPFGGNLHVSGNNRNKLLKSIEKHKDDAQFQWVESEPSMEDAFIYYMNKAQKEGGL